MTRELPPADAINLPRDDEPIEYLDTTVDLCPHCDPEPPVNAELIASTIEWAHGFPEVYGRCSACGQKYCEGEVRP